jgi:hypothetical protein
VGALSRENVKSYLNEKQIVTKRENTLTTPAKSFLAVDRLEFLIVNKPSSPAQTDEELQICQDSKSLKTRLASSQRLTLTAPKRILFLGSQPLLENDSDYSPHLANYQA